MSDFISGLPHLLCGWMQTGMYVVSYLFNLTISDGKPAGLVENGTNETWARIYEKNLKALSCIFSIF